MFYFSAKSIKKSAKNQQYSRKIRSGSSDILFVTNRFFCKMSSSSNKNNGYYVCHCCLRYRSLQTTDMKRHFNKKYPCSILYKTPLSRTMLCELTIMKKYVFTELKLNSLTNDDIFFILHNYHDRINYIDQKYRSVKNIIEQFQSDQLETNKNINTEQGDTNIHIKTTDVLTPSVINLLGEPRLTEKEYELKCYDCHAIFTKRSSLARHIKSGKQCALNRVLYENKLKHLGKYTKSDTVSKNTDSSSGNINIGGNVEFIGNVTNNTQNNNTHLESKTMIEVRDFIHDIYDHSHLDYRELSNDFFLLENFLGLMMENKVNHNIVYMDSDFSNAIVYTRNDLRKMPSDKVGFIMLQKLHKTMNDMIQHLCKVNDHKQEMNYLSKYYRIITDKYRCDTTYREYDVQTKTFYSTQQGSQLRCRDEYLADIIRVLNKHRTQIKQDIFQGIAPDDINAEYILINPNIEDFSSVRARYRDMKS